MLRLKLALQECGIPQQNFVRSSGFSKALISRVLKSGELPRDVEKFKESVSLLVAQSPGLQEWLGVKGLMLDNLLEIIIPPAPRSLGGAEGNPTLNELECLLYEVAGRAALAPDDCLNNMVIIRMAQVTIFLRRKIAEMVGHDAPWTVQTEAEAAAILKG
jgi:hypothetical protein